MTEDNFQLPEGYEEDDFFSFLDKKPSRRSKRRVKYARQLRKNRVPFGQRPAKVRRAKTVSLAWRIRSDANGRGVFYSRDILPGSREWPFEDGKTHHHAWANFVFLSRRPRREGVIYNAYAITALEKAAQEIEEKAGLVVEEQISEEDKALGRERVYSKRLPDGGVSMVFAPHRGLPSLGGLTKEGAKAKWLRENWEKLSELVEVRTKVELDPEYVYGLGVHLVVGQTSVDCQSIPQIIEDFLDRYDASVDLNKRLSEQGGVVDLSEIIDLLRVRMRATLWRWDYTQATAEGREMDKPDEELWPYFDTHSNAVRM